MKGLPNETKVPRSIFVEQTNVTQLQHDGFADASVKGCSAVVYAVIKHNESTDQGILVSKSSLVKKDLNNPRLELVSCEMLSNLMFNTSKALGRFSVTAMYTWTDSTVCLYLIQGNGVYKQFVTNQVNKIREKNVCWRHVSTIDNPADIGSRGCNQLIENG